jgi:hypothetical protein
MHIVYALLTLFFSFTSIAQVVGFSNGNDLNAVAISGLATLTCSDGQLNRTIVFECRDSSLAPNEFDFFVGPGGLGADSVELNVTHADLSTRSKTLGYTSSGTSRTRFNLWLNSFVQKPLLAYGENRVDFKLSASGRLIYQGRFSANVRYAGELKCLPGEFFSSNLDDCDQPYTLCRKYFEGNNNCR